MRREFLLWILSVGASLGLIGCRAKMRFKVDSQPTTKRPATDWRAEFSRAIIAQEPDSGVTFAPVLVGILVELLVQLVKQCVLPKLLAQHRAVNRRPDGATAKAWKENVAAAYREKAPDASADDVESHVAGAFEAFREASAEELTESLIGLQAEGNKPNADDWERAGRTVRAIEDVRE